MVNYSEMIPRGKSSLVVVQSCINHVEYFDEVSSHVINLNYVVGYSHKFIREKRFKFLSIIMQ